MAEVYNYNWTACTSRQEALSPRVTAGGATRPEVDDWVRCQRAGEKSVKFEEQTVVVRGTWLGWRISLCSPLGTMKWLGDSRVRAGEFAACWARCWPLTFGWVVRDRLRSLVYITERSGTILQRVASASAIDEEAAWRLVSPVFEYRLTNYLTDVSSPESGLVPFFGHIFPSRMKRLNPKVP